MQRRKIFRKMYITQVTARVVYGNDRKDFREETWIFQNKLKGTELEQRCRGKVKKDLPPGSVFIECLKVQYFIERREMNDEFFYNNSKLLERKEVKE